MKRNRWHTYISWQSGAGVILVRGGYVESTLRRRRRIAHQLARWAWGALPGEMKPAAAPGARQRVDELRRFREAG